MRVSSLVWGGVRAPRKRDEMAAQAGVKELAQLVDAAVNMKDEQRCAVFYDDISHIGAATRCGSGNSGSVGRCMDHPKPELLEGPRMKRSRSGARLVEEVEETWGFYDTLSPPENDKRRIQPYFEDPQQHRGGSFQTTRSSTAVR
jgi:hypothetical protein